MTPLLLAAMFGGALTLLIWVLRKDLVRRFESDVAWLEHMIWRFTPDPFDGRLYVSLYYLISTVVLIALLAILPSSFMAVVIWLVLFMVPKMMVNRAWEKRRKAIHDQLPGSVLKMSTSVASGMSLIQAMERLAEREPAPINLEFKVIANYWNLGADLGSTIDEAKRRLRIQDFNLFASAILINQRMGGNIVVTLERLAESLESIANMRAEIFAATAEGRQNIKVLAVAPLVMLAFVAFIDFHAVMMLFTTPLGNILLGAAILLVLVGTLWAWKIINADI